MSSVPLLQVRDALCRIGRQSVLRIDQFNLYPGQHWCVFGPNGAGKSQFAALLQGRRIESGKYVQTAPGFRPDRHCFVVSFEEQQRLWQRDNRLDISEYSAEAQDQGTTVEALLRGARHNADQDEPLLQALLDDLSLQTFSQRGIRFLSSGQVRKALLARGLYGALGSSGKLLILDEPLESIDRQSRQHIDACIARYLDDSFASIHLSRRVSEIPPYCTHLALFRELALIDQGEIDVVRGTDAFAALTTTRPELPASIPVVTTPQSSPPEPLIELSAVNAAYGEQAILSDINWRMGVGEHVLVEGPNGCGKSTLLSLIDGENHKGYGQNVVLFGRRKGSGESVWELKARFGLVSNELHNKYVKGWRVIDVVVSGFFDSVGLYDDSGGAEKERARAWLDTCGLKALESRYYHELSFGQQRLVLLARAMVKQPVILVLDEPCVGLDDLHRAKILGLLDLIARDSATQLIYVSHIEGEQPRCINRRYRFVPVEQGGYTLTEAEL